MKKGILYVVIAVGIIAVTDLNAQATLQIVVKNINEIKGSIRVGLFTTETDFLKKASEGKVVKATASEITVVFDNLVPGDYAPSVIHDINDNGELDTNFMGIPKEGFAFGNNSMGTFGPPSFDKAKITVGKEGVKQEITLKYF